MEFITQIPTVVAFTALLVAAAIDVVAFEVPDVISIVIGVMAVSHGLITPDFAWWPHALAPVLMFAFGLLAFARGWLGGGDVKLMTATAAWTGIGGLPVFFLATSIAGGVLLLTLFILRRGWKAARGTVPSFGKVLSSDAPIPYAVAVAVGAVWWAWSSSGALGAAT